MMIVLVLAADTTVILWSLFVSFRSVSFRFFLFLFRVTTDSVFLNDDNAINRKLRAVLRHNMKPILCIGETKSEYDAGLVKSASIY